MNRPILISSYENCSVSVEFSFGLLIRSSGLSTWKLELLFLFFDNRGVRLSLCALQLIP